MQLNNKILRTTILAGVSAIAISTFTQSANAQIVIHSNGNASVSTGGGWDHSDNIISGGPDGGITVNANIAVTNNGTTGTGNPNAEIILMDDAVIGQNTLTLLTGSSLTLTGGENSTVNASQAGAIIVANGATIRRSVATSDPTKGNAIFARNNITIVNNGLITASVGNGTIETGTNNGSLTYSGTGAVTNTGGTNGADDAIRHNGTGAANITFTGAAANVSSAAGGSAIDLSVATGTQTVTFADGAGSTAGGIRLGGSAANAASLNFEGTGDSLITGDIAGTAATNTTLTINKTAGTATVTGAITDFDTLNVTAGGFALNRTGNTSFTDITVANGATLNLTGVNGKFGGTTSFAVSGALEVDADSLVTGNLSLANGSTLTGTGPLTFDELDSTLTFTGNGDSTYSHDINGGLGTDVITVNRAAGNVVTLAGAVSGFETVNVNAGNLTFTGAVTDVVNFNVAAGQTLTFGTHASDVSFTQIDLQGNNSAVVFDRAGQAFSGNIVDSNGGAGTQIVTLTNGTLGVLGINTIDLGDFSDILLVNGGTLNSAVMMGAGNDIITFDGGTINGVINMGANGADAFNVSRTGLTTGNTIDGVDVFNVGTGNTFTSNHAINGTTNGAGNLNLSAGSTFHAAGANSRFGGNVDFGNGSTLHINTGRTVTAANVSGANGTLTVGFNNVEAGKLILTGLADMSAYTLNPLVDPGLTITGSKAYVIVDGQAGNATRFGTLIDTNTLFTFTQTEDDVNGDIILNIARQNQMSEITKDPNTKSAAPSVEQMLTINTNTPQANRDPVTVAFAARLTTSTDAQINEILQTVIPTVDQGGVMAAINVKHQAYAQVNARLADARVGNTTGMSAGDAGQGVRYWMQGFGSAAEQDRRQGIAGYDAETYGLSVGADADVSDNALAGLAFSYADTEVDSKNANRTKTEVDSYQLTAYGSYDWKQGTYVNGYASYSYNDIESARHNVGIIGNTASADYHTNQYDARVEVGHDFNNVLTSGLSVTPELSVQYTAVDAERYTEKGAGGLGLQNVESDTLQALELGADVTLAYQHRTANGGVLTPSVSVGYIYEALGENLQTSGSFIGGGAAFTTKGYDPAQHSVTGGLGLKYSTTNSWDFSADYDYTRKSDYDAHSGIVKAIYSF